MGNTEIKDLSSETEKLKILHQKISQGMELAFTRLVNYKKNNNGILVFLNNGKIHKVNAKDIQL